MLDMHEVISSSLTVPTKAKGTRQGAFCFGGECRESSRCGVSRSWACSVLRAELCGAAASPYRPSLLYSHPVGCLLLWWGMQRIEPARAQPSAVTRSACCFPSLTCSSRHRSLFRRFAPYVLAQRRILPRMRQALTAPPYSICTHSGAFFTFLILLNSCLLCEAPVKKQNPSVSNKFYKLYTKICKG